jgi:hypothetical protein
MAKEKVYYSTVGKQIVMVPAYDKDGKPVEKINKNGQPEYDDNGNPKYVVKAITFTRGERKVVNGQEARHCVFTTSDPAVIAALDKLVADRKSSVVSEKEFNTMINPMYAVREELEVEKLKNTELVKEVAAAKAEAESTKKMLEEMKRQAAAIKK